MVVNKRKKNSRQKGSHTYGWGAMKKHRGAGNRGGRGMAGTGKRGDAKKPSIWKERYFGKFGFKPKGLKTKINPMNLIDIENNLDLYLQKKLIRQEQGKLVFNLEDLGYNKLLSKGKIRNKYLISTPLASEKAINKIKDAGGEVILTTKSQKQ